MSVNFSARLKDELWQKSASIGKDCCKASFLAAILSLKAVPLPENGLRIVLPSPAASLTLKTLFSGYFLSAAETSGALLIANNDALTRFLRLTGIGGDLSGLPVFLCGECFGHYLRGLFLSCGTLADPQKSHHLSLFAKSRTPLLRELIEEHGGPEFKIGTRRQEHYLYLKRLSAIEDFLTLVGAGRVTMELLNRDLEHSMRAFINRQNNFDTANLSRTLEWNRKVLSSIEKLQKNGRYDALSPALKTMARAAVRHPDDTLQKLGGRLKPRLSKSGVYHRLRKLIDLAKE